MSAGISFIEAPAASINTLYSGKYGANTINSSPGHVRPFKQQHNAAAAPTVQYRLSALKDVWKRELIESAIILRTPASPCALV